MMVITQKHTHTHTYVGSNVIARRKIFPKVVVPPIFKDKDKKRATNVNHTVLLTF